MYNSLIMLLNKFNIKIENKKNPQAIEGFII